MKMFRIVFLVIGICSFLLLSSCFRTAPVAVSPEMSIPVCMPGERVITSETETTFRKKDDQFFKILPDSEAECTENECLVKKGALFSGSGMRFSFFQEISAEFLFKKEQGSFSFIRFSLPVVLKLSDSHAVIHYFYNDRDEYLQEVSLSLLDSDEQYAYYGFFVPYNLLWKERQIEVSCTMQCDQGGLLKFATVYTVPDREFITQTIKFSKNKSQEISNTNQNKYKEEQRVRWELWNNVKACFGKTAFTEPLEDMQYVTSQLGMTREWVLSNGKVYSKSIHLGIDLYAPKGAPVANVLEGEVVFAGNAEYYGNMVIVNYGMGLCVSYCHLNEIKVKQGMRVAPGVLLGRVGMTGSATGPHLHFEARIYGLPVDPFLLGEFNGLFL